MSCNDWTEARPCEPRHRDGALGLIHEMKQGETGSRKRKGVAICWLKAYILVSDGSGFKSRLCYLPAVCLGDLPYHVVF